MKTIDSIADGIRICEAYTIPKDQAETTNIRSLKPWIYCLEDLNQMTIKKEFVDADTFLHQGAVALLKSLTKRHDFAWNEKQLIIAPAIWNTVMTKIFHWLQWPKKENAPWRDASVAKLIRSELPEFADFAMTPDLPRPKALEPYSVDLDLLDEMTTIHEASPHTNMGAKQVTSQVANMGAKYKNLDTPLPKEQSWCKDYMAYLNILLRYEAQLNWQKSNGSIPLPGPGQFGQSLHEKRKCLHLRMH